MDNSLRPIDHYFLQKRELVKSCLEALRIFITSYNSLITEEWKYRMPFYYYKGKMFCYLWTDKKTNQPYIGIMEGRNIEHPLLVQDNRKRAKILYVDTGKDIDVHTIKQVLDMAIVFYK
ncbi:MAG: DUF1801 domain-containing protein [Sphingobacteriaceae bacterium]|nr:MAG: DUF1801 domain-containing protein [Sphingobacteriaceae bacterium]